MNEIVNKLLEKKVVMKGFGENACLNIVETEWVLEKENFDYLISTESIPNLKEFLKMRDAFLFLYADKANKDLDIAFRIVGEAVTQD